jgi:nicotinamide-nucleotide amidase
MFTDSVAPLLKRVLPSGEQFVCRTLSTTSLGESIVQQRIHEPLQSLMDQGLSVGYCARPGQVDVRLSARGILAEKMVTDAAKIVRDRLGARVFGEQDDEMEAVIVRLLAERKQTLAVAESCTGGCIAHRVTNVPGASAVFAGGFVTYSNEAKQKLLGVRAETLKEDGAVSEAVAREMAEGARGELAADYALSVTGIAGPTGGTKQKPVGTVFIGLAAPEGITVEKGFNPYDRETFKWMTAQQALDLLRRHLRER